MKKIRNYVLLMPLLIAFLASLYGAYVFSHKIYDSSSILTAVSEQGILKNIVKSLMLERESIEENKDPIEMELLKRKTNEYVASLIASKDTEDRKNLSLVSQVNELRENINNNIYFLTVFFSFYGHIGNSIIESYSNFSESDFLDADMKLYIIAIRSIYSSINSINLDREYIAKAIANNENVTKMNTQRWLSSNDFNLDTMTFLPFNEAKNRLSRFINNSGTYSRLNKIAENILKSMDVKNDYVSQSNLYAINALKYEQFLFLLEISNILESEMLIHNKKLLYQYQMYVMVFVMLCVLFVFTFYALAKKIKSLETTMLLINDLHTSFNPKNSNDDIRNILLKFKDTYKNLKNSFDYLSKFNEIKNVYLKKIAKKHSEQMDEKLHSISFLRKSFTSLEQIKAINILDGNHSKSSIDFANLANIIHFENKSIELNEQPFYPQEIFSIALESRLDEIEDKNINYVTFIDPKLQNELIGDKDKILSVISNIISCAIYQCNQYSKVTVEIKQDVNENRTDVASIQVVVKNNAEYVFHENLNQKQTDILGITNEYMSFWLSVSDMYLKSIGSKLDIKSTKDVGNQFSFEMALRIKNTSESNYKDNELLVAYISDADKDYNAFFEKILTDMGIEFDTYMSYGKIDKSKEYNVILSRKNKNSSYGIQDLITIADPLTPLKIEQYMQKDIGHDESHKFTLAKPKILIMEDNPINLSIIKYAFSEHNVEILNTNEYKNITDIVKRRRYDIIFMDTALPAINPIEVAKRYKNSNLGRYTPIVAMISNTSYISSQEAMGVFDDVIKKPFNKTDLNRILTSFIPNFETFSSADNIYIRSNNILLYKKTSIENKVFAGALAEFSTYLSMVDSFDEFKEYMKDTIYGIVLIDDTVKDFDIQKVLETIEESRVYFGVNTKLYIFSNKSQSNFSIKHYVKILSPQISKTQIADLVRQEFMGGGTSRIE